MPNKGFAPSITCSSHDLWTFYDLPAEFITRMGLSQLCSARVINIAPNPTFLSFPIFPRFACVEWIRNAAATPTQPRFLLWQFMMRCLGARSRASKSMFKCGNAMPTGYRLPFRSSCRAAFLLFWLLWHFLSGLLTRKRILSGCHFLVRNLRFVFY